jgi:hypothetical protein
MLVNLIGILGVILLLGSFILSTAALLNDRIKQSSNKWAAPYSLANFLGAAMLAYYAYALNNIIFLIVESTWSVVGLVAVLQNLGVVKLLARITRDTAPKEGSQKA